MSAKEGRGMRLGIGRTGAIAAMGLMLTGCISLGGKVPDQLITLTADETAPAGDLTGGDAANAIVVRDPDTDRRLDVTRVPVQTTPSSLAYLKDAMWVEKPARQFRRLLAETIRAKSGKVVLEGSDSEVSGGTTVSGRLVDMGYDAQLQAVVVRYDAVVETLDGKVRSRRFEAEVPGIPANAANVGPALNEAANEVAAEVADWVIGA